MRESERTLESLLRKGPEEAEIVYRLVRRLRDSLSELKDALLDVDMKIARAIEEEDYKRIDIDIYTIKMKNYMRNLYTKLIMVSNSYKNIHTPFPRFLEEMYRRVTTYQGRVPDPRTLRKNFFSHAAAWLNKLKMEIEDYSGIASQISRNPNNWEWILVSSRKISKQSIEKIFMDRFLRI